MNCWCRGHRIIIIVRSMPRSALCYILCSFRSSRLEACTAVATITKLPAHTANSVTHHTIRACCNAATGTRMAWSEDTVAATTGTGSQASAPRINTIGSRKGIS